LPVSHWPTTRTVCTGAVVFGSRFEPASRRRGEGRARTPDVAATILAPRPAAPGFSAAGKTRATAAALVPERGFVGLLGEPTGSGSAEDFDIAAPKTTEAATARPIGKRKFIRTRPHSYV